MEKWRENDAGACAIASVGSLRALRQIAAACTRCPLYRHATQTVFGEGPGRASIVLIGEQPGDREDIEGKPFVGPAGKLLDACLKSAGLDRPQLYVTNAVKHFKWEAVGKRRLHKKPSAREVAACKPWLQAELRFIQPKLVVALGATAAQALMGPGFRVTKARGQIVPFQGNLHFMATVHPSSLLRAPSEDRAEQTELFTQDLRKAALFVK
jgi:uracil-DNA glycosylase